MSRAPSNRRTAGPPDRPTGHVSLVGAGPGAPDLLTYRAIQRLDAADVVLYDGLVPREILRLAARARHVSVARRAGTKCLAQVEVIDRMILEARQGCRVVRLKAGDPFVLGRGGEEAVALARAGVPFEVVPGLTSALAAPALAGIPMTHRGLAAAFVVVSGHSPASYARVLEALVPGSATIVVLMGLGQRAAIASCLTSAGWTPATPTAIVINASHADQRVWIGTLAHLPQFDVASPDDAGVIVVGDVVSIATASEMARPFMAEENLWQPTTTHKL